MSADLFIFAGEPSGDLHGEKLLKELYAENPKLKVQGVGGPKMRAVGMECLLPMEEFQVMGFIDILSALPKLRRHFKTLKNHLLKHPPKAVISIDYPGFNLRLANALRKAKSPAKRIHYICPTVWAWGKRRIPKMERSLDQLLTILPFEPDLFSKHALSATYVGHPLISRIQNHPYDPDWHRPFGIEKETLLLSIFPGSREKEIIKNFPLQLRVAKEIQQENPDLTLAISCSNEALRPLIEKEDKNLIIIPENKTYELMRATHLAIATSGTVTLELALHEVPTVVTFAISPLDVFIAQNIFRIDLPHYALPNILHRGELFPELFGPNFTAGALHKHLSRFLESEVNRSQVRTACKALKTHLGKKNAGVEAARIILEILND
ncbi:MAG: lipid-A-disaccharide synthase [Chlamydiia bacterium]|nr:lipid-A-disaccharide synthase [Chlamydiia bacterium]